MLARRLYDKCLNNCFDEYKSIIDAQKEKMDNKYYLINLFLKEYAYSKQYEDLDDNAELDDEKNQIMKKTLLIHNPCNRQKVIKKK